MELPFQWDDDNFISPFVASSEETLAALAAWMSDRLHFRLPADGALRLTDLGCGDGGALFSVAAALAALRSGEEKEEEERESESVAVAAPLRFELVGLDLDEELIAKARRRAESMSLRPPHSMRCGFETADVRHFDAAEYFPPSAAASHVLFLYLLPEALEILRERLLEIFPRVALLVSNRWEVPFLSRWKVTQLQNLYIYRYMKSEV